MNYGIVHAMRGSEWLLIPTQSRPSSFSPDISILLFRFLFLLLLRVLIRMELENCRTMTRSNVRNKTPGNCFPGITEEIFFLYENISHFIIAINKNSQIIHLIRKSLVEESPSVSLLQMARREEAHDETTRIINQREK